MGRRQMSKYAEGRCAADLSHRPGRCAEGRKQKADVQKADVQKADVQKAEGRCADGRWQKADVQKADVQAYLPHRPSFKRRVSFELRKGTKTKPFFLALPSALIHSASASKDLHHCTFLLSFTNVTSFIHEFCCYRMTCDSHS